MKIVACLGNPGKKYEKNRHNIGFITGERVVRDYSFPSFKSKNEALISTSRIHNQDVTVVLPQSYMNNSGEPIQKIMKFFKSSLEDLIVIHDELELSFSKINLKNGGGHKGHNGIRSIINCCGGADFMRLRFGIGRPENPNISVADYVLSDFTNEEFEKIELVMPDLDVLIKKFVLSGGK